MTIAVHAAGIVNVNHVSIVGLVMSSRTLPNADDPRGGTPMNTDDELRKRLNPKLMHSHECEDVLIDGFPCICGAVDEILALLHKSNLQRTIEELKNFNLPQYDHSKCPDPKTCIGYENAQSDFDNEKELRINELQAELQQLEKGNV